MSSLTALFAVNVVIWIGIGSYLAYLTVQQKQLKQKITQWENTDDTHDNNGEI